MDLIKERLLLELDKIGAINLTERRGDKYSVIDVEYTEFIVKKLNNKIMYTEDYEIEYEGQIDKFAYRIGLELEGIYLKVDIDYLLFKENKIIKDYNFDVVVLAEAVCANKEIIQKIIEELLEGDEKEHNFFMNQRWIRNGPDKEEMNILLSERRRLRKIQNKRELGIA